MTAQDDAQVPDRPPLLISPAKGRVIALPNWARYFMEAGSFVAMRPPTPPMTLAFSLPTRAFAAVFAGLGVVHARRKFSSAPIDQFEEVWAMTEDVLVRYRLRGQATPGVGLVTDRVEKYGSRYLVIKDRKTGNTQPPQHLIEELVIQRAGPARRPRTLSFDDPWLAQMLEGCEAEQYLFHDRHDCLIVGQDNLLQREAGLELQLPAARQGIPRLSGKADCVLRVRRWQGAGKVFSSDVLPTSSDPEDVDLRHLQAFPVVIFDGASAFLRWQHRLRRQHHIVLLSRTDRRLDEAVSVLDQAFMVRAEQTFPVPDVPPGIEALVFGRGR